MIDPKRVEGIIGFLTPHMVEATPGGGVLNAFSDPADIDRIQKGYACGNCCAVFDGFRLDCPLCRQPTEVARRDAPAPQVWADHVREREHGDTATGTRSIDEFLRALAADKDVDQVPLSRLKPSRWGRK